MRIHPFLVSLLRLKASRTPMGAILVGAFTLFAARRRQKRLAAARVAPTPRRSFSDVVDDGWEVTPAAV